MSEETNDSKWHVDKRIPLALILTIVVQTGAGIWWISSLSERVNSLERDTLKTAPQAERIVRLETRMETIVEGISEIKRILRREAQ